MSENTGLRLSAMAIVALSLLGALTARLAYLTTIEAEASAAAAKENRVRVLHIQAPRGRILDRHRRILVDNRQVRQVRIDPRALDEAVGGDEDRKEAVYQRLADELSRSGIAMSEQDVEDALAENQLQVGPYLPVPIADDVSEDFEILVAENQMDFPGVDVQRVAVRDYPYGTVAAHLLGYVGSITQEELDSIENPEKPYEPGDDVGKTGIEREYEQWLRGTPGTRTIEVDAEGEVVRELGYVAPVPGDDIRLNLNIQVQMLLESRLAQQADLNEATGAAGMVLDPRNGQVIAMASYPTFDPQAFIGGISQRDYDVLSNDDRHPLNNRVISGEYAPGSTFKPVTAIAGLRAGVVHPGDSFYDDGTYEVAGCSDDTCIFRNADEVELGNVNLERSLTVSSDWYYYRIGDNLWAQKDRLGDDYLQQVTHEFGFVADTGVDLPGEHDGFAFTPELVAQYHEENPSAFPYGDWHAGNTINMSIGQGDLGVTPIQLTNMYAAIANGGTLWRPHVAQQILDPEPADNVWLVDKRLEQERIGHVDLPPGWRDPILRGLLGVPQSGIGGTAGEAFDGFDLAGYPIGGKTGTAQVEGLDNGLFVGFGPVLDGQRPRYVVSAIFEGVEQFGGTVAAPVVRAVFDGLRDPALLPMPLSAEATPTPTPSTTSSPGGESP